MSASSSAPAPLRKDGLRTASGLRGIPPYRWIDLGLVIVLALLAGALIAFGLVLGSTPQWMRQAADVGETIAGIILVPAAVLALRLW